MNAEMNLGDEIIGIDRTVPLLNGTERRYVCLDNAATTPAFRSIQEKVAGALEWYGSIHRGAGFKCLVSTRAYSRARELVARFFGADPGATAVIFVKNATEAINRLAGTIAWNSGDIVLSTTMEHHSNDLPWRAHARVEYVRVDREGALDMDDFARLLKVHSGRVRLVAVTGASNVTGFLPPIHDIAELAHARGAMVLVDAAQLAARRAIELGPPGKARSIDFLAASGHKMYAPFGAGVLLGPKEFFRKMPPDHAGGGTIEVVNRGEVYWTDPPARNEAGTPNLLGAVALATAIRILCRFGMKEITEHDKALTAHALEQLGRISGLRIYGSRDPKRLDDRIGVIPFAVDGIPHAKVAAILSFEAGIGVRSGCFCAHPYVLHLLGIEGTAYESYKARVLAHDRSDTPGLVRVSLGCYNTRADLDYLAEWLKRIVAGRYGGDYFVDKASGDYFPRGFDRTILQRCFDV